VLLTGSFARTLDEKNRIGLPKRVREQLGSPSNLFVSPGPDKSLWLYTSAALERLGEALDRSPATDADARKFRRLYFAQTESVDVDRAGRILIPERLGRFGELKREVVLLGVRDHLEIWDAERWRQYLAENAARFDAVAEGAFRSH
jgi:MraZ protein